MNKWIFASMLFLAAFVAAIGTVSADEVAESAESETAENVEAEPEVVPKLFLFVVDPEGELHFEGTIAPYDSINLKVSAYDAAGDVRLVSVRSTREGCSQTETNLGNFSGGEHLELHGPWDENSYVFFWAWTEHEGQVIVTSVCSVYVEGHLGEA
jgi:hypothetical protein